MRHLLILGVFSLVFSGNVWAETKTQTHTYTTIGTKTATVTVCDQFNACTSQSVTINVRGNSAPVVTLSCSPTSGLSPLTISCTATASDPDGDTITYSWNFGDSTPPPTSGLKQTHTYAKKGVYYPSFSAKDPFGLADKEIVKVNCNGRLGCK